MMARKLLSMGLTAATAAAAAYVEHVCQLVAVGLVLQLATQQQCGARRHSVPVQAKLVPAAAQ
jgi:hypothetical protein